MGTILLNNEPYVLGTAAIGIGYNKAGKRTIESISIDIDGDDIVCNSGGIRIKMQPNDLQDCYLDNAKNRKILREKIKLGAV